MTSRRFDNAAKAIKNLQRKVKELDRRASRKGHGHVLLYTQRTADQTGITSVTNINVGTEAVTVPAGRRLKITGHAQISLTPSGTEDIAAVGEIREGTTVLGRWGTNVEEDIDATRSQLQDGCVIVTPSAGSHTYELSLRRSVGAGSVGVQAAADNPAFLLIEDIGPA